MKKTRVSLLASRYFLSYSLLIRGARFFQQESNAVPGKLHSYWRLAPQRAPPAAREEVRDAEVYVAYSPVMLSYSYSHHVSIDSYNSVRISPLSDRNQESGIRSQIPDS